LARWNCIHLRRTLRDGPLIDQPPSPTSKRASISIRGPDLTVLRFSTALSKTKEQQQHSRKTTEQEVPAVSTSQIQKRTRMFARVLGPYLLIAAASLATRPTYASTLLQAFDTNTAWPWVIGAFVVPMGLAVIALHPYWHNPAAATVLILGWLTLLKGVALMTFPQNFLSVGQDAVSAAPWWQISVIIVVIVGLYLAVVGWAPNRPASSTTTPANLVHDLPQSA
jgi:hypothetical protein